SMCMMSGRSWLNSDIVVSLHRQPPGQAFAVELQTVIGAAVGDIENVDRLIPLRERMPEAQLAHLHLPPARPPEPHRMAWLVATTKCRDHFYRFVQESFVIHFKNPLKLLLEKRFELSRPF